MASLWWPAYEPVYLLGAAVVVCVALLLWALEQ
jgi:hypothetical protein